MERAENALVFAIFLLGLFRDLELRRALAAGEGEQIVVLEARDFHGGEFADGEIFSDVHATVDVGCIGVAASDARFFHEHAQGLADMALADARGDFLLELHQPVPTRFLSLGGNLVFHLRAARAFFLRVTEHAQALEFRFADEGFEFGDVGLGFTGEADDKRGAYGDAGNARADAFDEIADVVTAGLALHGTEHVVADVLERDVDVAGDLRALGDGADELVAPMRGVRVKQANPEITFDGVEFAQERRECGAARRIDGCARIGALFPSVHAEEGGVLGNEIELFHAFFDELAGLGDDAFDGATAVAAADLRDDAERARMVAALGDFHVRGVLRREAETRGVEIGNVGRARGDEVFRDLAGGAVFGVETFDNGSDLGHLVEADERIDFVVERRGKVFGETLRHAAGDDEFLLLAAFFHAAVLMHLKDVADGFFLGGVDEGAGVDDDHIGQLGFGDDAHAGLMEVADHDFAIDEIFCATEGDEADLDHDLRVRADVWAG